MKTKTSKKSGPSKKSLLLGLVVLCALVVGGIVLYRHVYKHAPSGSSHGINYGPPTAQEKKSAEDQKVKSIENQPASQQSATNQAVSISSISQASSGRDVIVETQLTGRGWSKCTLTLSKAGASSITQSVDVLYQPSYSTCMGFSISSSNFASSGTWTANLSVTNSDGSTAKAKPAEISLSL